MSWGLLDDGLDGGGRRDPVHCSCGQEEVLTRAPNSTLAPTLASLTAHRNHPCALQSNMSLQSLATKMPSPPGTAMSNTSSTSTRVRPPRPPRRRLLHGLRATSSSEGPTSRPAAAAREARQMWTATGKPRKQEQLSILKAASQARVRPQYSLVGRADQHAPSKGRRQRSSRASPAFPKAARSAAAFGSRNARGPPTSAVPESL